MSVILSLYKLLIWAVKITNCIMEEGRKERREDRRKYYSKKKESHFLVYYRTSHIYIWNYLYKFFKGKSNTFFTSNIEICCLPCWMKHWMICLKIKYWFNILLQTVAQIKSHTAPYNRTVKQCSVYVICLKTNKRSLPIIPSLSLTWHSRLWVFVSFLITFLT